MAGPIAATPIAGCRIAGWELNGARLAVAGRNSAPGF